jgi:Sulfotransferase family
MAAEDGEPADRRPLNRVMISDRLPNFFLVGASKAGTTALYRALAWHPQIYVSPIKEVHYFAQDIDTSRFRRDYQKGLTDYRAYLRTDMSKPAHNSHITTWEDYLELFRNVTGERAVGEGSTSYLFSPCAARAIRDKLPSARIIIVLRNPLERAFSNYLMDLRTGYVRRSFLRELEDDLRDTSRTWGYSRLYVEGGLYSEQVGRYLETFPRVQLKILLSEDLRYDWRFTLTELYEFLGVESDMTPAVSYENKAAAPRLIWLNFLMLHSGLKRWVSSATPRRLKQFGKPLFYSGGVTPVLSDLERATLRDLFRHDVKKLERLLERDLSAWLA